MEITELGIAGVFLIEPKKFGDNRGYFMETFRKEIFEKVVGRVDFVQENESKSRYGVVRGLHFQKGDFSQAKLVRASLGRVLDVVVDLRRQSATFGRHVAVELSDENARQLFMPRGMAHGFAVLSEEAIFSYKVDSLYAPLQEGSLLYNDPVLGIDWQIANESMVLSPKDLAGVPLSEVYCFD